MCIRDSINTAIGIIFTMEKKDIEEEKSLTSEEKKLLKKLEKGELDLLDTSKGPINKDPKYQTYTDMGYEVHPKEGLLYRDSETISRQRKAILQLIKTLGSNILRGKSLMNISMPVSIFDKATMLQRAAIDFTYAPIYMEKIYETEDPVDKMKYAVAFYVAGLHLNLSQKKPFNPIWGETYQGRIGEDLDVYCEQISHHPAITFAYLDAPHYNLTAKHEYSLKIYPNSAAFRCNGYRKIIMKDSARTTYLIKYPWAESKGFMFGLPSFSYYGDIVIKDKTNKIYAMLRLHAGKKSFAEAWFKKSDVRNDFFKGLITKNKALLKDSSKKVFYSKDMLSYIEGNWIDYVMIDGEKYWEIDKQLPLPVKDATNPLPSDSSFRDDLKAFIANDEVEAQKQKEIMEDIQRNDRKQREKYVKKK
eukprot:TRINITY_DN5757_c0_g1_i14.p1 TRINITY_DN5757_c0_g1~~TRINITY_DN5757_c0_g1_i14.p1  ORF type:complete len:418 (+),score=154.50 TRINITY_DN5757_c0_g1_i14:73-1326(+)